MDVPFEDLDFLVEIRDPELALLDTYQAGDLEYRQDLLARPP